MPSVLNVDTIADAAGTGPVALTKQSAAKAWVRYNQYSSPVGITDSFDISSVSDDAAGVFTITKTNAMSDANYPITATAASLYTNDRPFIIGPAGLDGTWTTTQIEITTTYYENTKQDSPRSCVVFYGDLA